MEVDSMEEKRATSSHPVPFINITPLIDVLLVLLIIFMVIAPKRLEKLPVRAPGPAVSDPVPGVLMLTLSASGLALNSQPVASDNLIEILAPLMLERPMAYRTLFISGPSSTDYHRVASLVDLARGAGVETIGLLAEGT